MPTPRAPRPDSSLAGQLRRHILGRGLTAYAVAKAADVDKAVVARFLAGERDLMFETAGRICSSLGLKLAEVAPRGRGRPRRPTPD